MAGKNSAKTQKCLQIFCLRLHAACNMTEYGTVQKMKFCVTFFIKCDQIRSKLRIWSHLLKKAFMENFIFLCNVGFFWPVFPLIRTESSRKHTRQRKTVVLRHVFTQCYCRCKFRTP